LWNVRDLKTNSTEFLLAKGHSVIGGKKASKQVYSSMCKWITKDWKKMLPEQGRRDAWYCFGVKARMTVERTHLLS
jgi:hypothetical protein